MSTVVKDEITSILAFYEEAAKLKTNYESALNRLIESAKISGVKVCEEMTRVARKEHPEIVARMDEAYAKAQPLTNAMMRGKRWPDNRVGNTYAETLRAVPENQRSPEMNDCLQWWEEYAAAATEWERLHPTPTHFYWNGSMLTGPNLWPVFGIARDW
jgi:hypothetical protein